MACLQKKNYGELLDVVARAARVARELHAVGSPRTEPYLMRRDVKMPWVTGRKHGDYNYTSHD